jgi:hypothetical protein
MIHSIYYYYGNNSNSDYFIQLITLSVITWNKGLKTFKNFSFQNFKAILFLRLSHYLIDKHKETKKYFFKETKKVGDSLKLIFLVLLLF